jgi:dTDP-4-dehydrorhamnose reductase
MKVVVLGASGMLGSMVLSYLSLNSDFRVIGTSRTYEMNRKLQSYLPNIECCLLDAEQCDLTEIVNILGDANWAINAIGVIKPYIHDDNAAEVERAVAVNALFPHLLARAAEKTRCQVLQIATDCVYSGSRGSYSEKDNHDPLDVYGKTKSLGEVFSAHVHHLRCSIIGPEPKTNLSLMEWFLHQPRNSSVNGYTNHRWNGITTLHFAKTCHGIIEQGLNLPHVQHVIPTGTVSKAELLKNIAHAYQREDITIIPTQTNTALDRTLSTINNSLNQKLWEAAGYTQPPSLPLMLTELAQFNSRLSLETIR